MFRTPDVFRFQGGVQTMQVYRCCQTWQYRTREQTRHLFQRLASFKQAIDVSLKTSSSCPHHGPMTGPNWVELEESFVKRPVSEKSCLMPGPRRSRWQAMQGPNDHRGTVVTSKAPCHKIVALLVNDFGVLVIQPRWPNH